MIKKKLRTDRTKGKIRTRKRSRFPEGIKEVDLNDIDFLRRFVTEHGKILPARLTGASAKQQRMIRRGICRARVLGLLP